MCIVEKIVCQIKDPQQRQEVSGRRLMEMCREVDALFVPQRQEDIRLCYLLSHNTTGDQPACLHTKRKYNWEISYKYYMSDSLL